MKSTHLELDNKRISNCSISCSIPEPTDMRFNFSPDPNDSESSMETIFSFKTHKSPRHASTLSSYSSYKFSTEIPQTQLSQSQSHGSHPVHITPSRSLRNLFSPSRSHSPSVSSTGLTVTRPSSARVASKSNFSPRWSSQHKSQLSFSSRSLRNLFSKVQHKITMSGSKNNRLDITPSHEHHTSQPQMHNLTITSKWRPDLDFILDDEEILQELITYMTKQYNEENILFLESIGKLECNINELLMFDEAIDPVTIDKINVEIAIIYATYITHDAHRQVNLSSACRTEIMSHYQQFKALTLKQKADMFIQCGNEISQLIQRSILSWFYQSNGFQSIAHSRNIFTNDRNVHNLFAPMRLSRVNVSDNVDYDSDDVAHDSEAKTDVYFDSHSSVKWTPHNKYMLSRKGFGNNSGSHEWKIKILKTSSKRQEFGVVSTFDKNIPMNEFGICDTPMFGARVVYGYNKKNAKHSFYYASYNKDNSVRCTKDLSLLKMHQSAWREGDVIRVALDLSKGIVKFYLNDKKVRKTISIERNKTYYPIILYAGKCEYQVIA
eukprot:175818_1